MAALSLLEKIAKANDIEEVEIPIPEWDVTILLKTPSMAKRSQLMEAQIRSREDLLNDDEGVEVQGQRLDMNSMQFSVIQACCFDPQSGLALFAVENTANDMAMLSDKNGRVVWELFETCQRLSGLAAEDEDAEGPVEEGKGD